MRIGFAESSREGYIAVERLRRVGHLVDVSNTNDMLLGQHSRQHFDLLIAEETLPHGMLVLELFDEIGKTPLIVIGRSRYIDSEVQDRGGIFVTEGDYDALMKAVQTIVR